jgi:methanogenic corrinoid protein MtbC1
VTAARDLVHAVCDDYLVALGAGDTTAAVRLARSLVEDGVPPADLLHLLVAPAQRVVGERWAAGEWNVAREHAATAVSETVIAVLAAAIEAGSERGHAVVACVEGEWHSLPARLVAETVRLAGWQVTFLGASTPPNHLAAFINEIGPDAVLLSCSLPTALPQARRMIEATREAGAPVLVGGRGFGADELRARRLGADDWAPDAVGAVEALQAWHPATGPAPPLRHRGADEHAEIALRREALVSTAYEGLKRRFPPMTDYSREQQARTKEDLGHILDFCGAALFVDDPRIFTEFVEWLIALLAARGVPAVAATAGMATLADAVPDLSLAATMLREAASRRS